MTTRISVLMATYNGMPYVGDQLASILSQTCKVDEVLVADDGSTDGTVSEVRRFAELDRRVRIIATDRVGSPLRNFCRLLTSFDGDIAMFADQDDVWFPDKVERARRGLEPYVDVPAYYYSDMVVVDSNMRVLSDSYFDHGKVPRQAKTFRRLVLSNSASGNTMALTLPLARASLPMSDAAINHDWWIALACGVIGGKVIFDPRPGLYYRQHERNAEGSKAWGGRRFLAEFQKAVVLRRSRLDPKVQQVGALVELALGGDADSICGELATIRQNPIIRRQLAAYKAGYRHEDPWRTMVFLALL